MNNQQQQQRNKENLYVCLQCDFRRNALRMIPLQSLNYIFNCLSVQLAEQSDLLTQAGQTEHKVLSLWYIDLLC